MLYLRWSRSLGGWRGSRDLTRRRPRSCSFFVTRSRCCVVRSASLTCRGRIARCCPADPTAVPVGPGTSPRHPRHPVVMASQIRQAVLDLPEPARPSTGQRRGQRLGRAAGSREYWLGTKANPGRTAWAGLSGQRRDDPTDPHPRGPRPGTPPSGSSRETFPTVLGRLITRSC
jgi:hypothetical protein